MKLEIYKCAALTIIAGVMVFFAWKVQSKQISVQVKGGEIDVSGAVDVGVDGSVEVHGKDEDPIGVEIEH
jgi:hypothetical protein